MRPISYTISCCAFLCVALAAEEAQPLLLRPATTDTLVGHHDPPLNHAYPHSVAFSVQDDPGTAEQDALFWRSIMDSSNPADFEAYLEQFPHGLFRTLARRRLAALQAPATDDTAARQQANRDFLGINFGIAFGMTTNLGSRDRVDEAEVTNGVVRVTKAANHRPRVLLETHYFWELEDDNAVVSLGGTEVPVRAADIGLGPFVAIQGSEDELLEAFAIGLMIGFKRTERSSFNIGLGVALDPNVKVLGDGLRPNKPLPDGETAIRFKEEARWGLVTLVSFSF